MKAEHIKTLSLSRLNALHTNDKFNRRKPETILFGKIVSFRSLTQEGLFSWNNMLSLQSNVL